MGRVEGDGSEQDSRSIGLILVTKKGRKVRIATYLRSSTDKQNLEHQRNSLNGWIESQGYQASTITEFTDEAISGSKGVSARPGFKALLKDIEGQNLDKVILFEGSRISRSMVDYLNFMNTAEKNGVSIEIVGRGVQGFSEPTDLLVQAIQGYMHQAERQNIRERISSGMDNAKKNGKLSSLPNLKLRSYPSIDFKSRK